MLNEGGAETGQGLLPTPKFNPSPNPSHFSYPKKENTPLLKRRHFILALKRRLVSLLSSPDPRFPLLRPLPSLNLSSPVQTTYSHPALPCAVAEAATKPPCFEHYCPPSKKTSRTPHGSPFVHCPCSSRRGSFLSRSRCRDTPR